MGSAIKDVDLVMVGDAPALALLLAKDTGGRVLAHSRFGTATIVLKGSRLDLATARTEIYPRPGALPQVSPGTIYDDLARRDFSINALALSLSEPQPVVLDPHRGLQDLQAGLIRILHPRSFVDDPTRILRAIRYEQRFGFRIEAETLNRLREALAQGYMSAISGDRIRHELEWIFQEGRPALALQRSIGLGVLDAIHPSFGNAFDIARLTSRRSATAADPPSTRLGKRKLEPLVYLAALCYTLSPPAVRAVSHLLKLPRSWAAVARDTVSLRQLEPQLATPSLSNSAIYQLAEGLAPPSVVAVARLSDSPLVAQRLDLYLTELRYVAPVLKGDDLASLGVPQGPVVGEILQHLHQARLDQEIFSETEERQWVLKYLATKHT